MGGWVGWGWGARRGWPRTGWRVVEREHWRADARRLARVERVHVEAQVERSWSVARDAPRVERRGASPRCCASHTTYTAPFSSSPPTHIQTPSNTIHHIAHAPHFVDRRSPPRARRKATREPLYPWPVHRERWRSSRQRAARPTVARAPRPSWQRSTRPGGAPGRSPPRRWCPWRPPWRCWAGRSSFSTLSTRCAPHRRHLMLAGRSVAPGGA